MSLENPIQRKGWIRVSRTSVMFRLNGGLAWLSGLGPKGVRWAKDRSYVQILAPRPIAIGFGLLSGDPVKGPGDLIGRTTVVITAAMVGKKVAVFTSLEAKREKGGRRSDEQISWDKQTREAGGISGFFTSEEEAEAIISDWHKKMEQQP